MVLYDNIDNSIKQKKQKLNNTHIRNLKIMNVLNVLVMSFLIAIDLFLLVKGIFTGMPNAVSALLIVFLVAQIGSLVVFAIKRFSRASMVTKVGIVLICFLPIIPYIMYLSIGNNIYIACLLGRIIGVAALSMLLFNTKTTNDKKTFGVKGVPLAIASIFAFLVLLYIFVSTTNRKVIYSYDNLYGGYVVTDVLAGKGNVSIKNDTVAISSNSLKNVSGNLDIPKNVKFIADDAFENSKVTSLTIHSSDITIMNAINNSNINKIYLDVEDANIDIDDLNKEIDIITNKETIDSYREKYRKYDYLFVPKLEDNEYYVCFNGTNLPVYIYDKPEIINQPAADSLPSAIDGKKILYDGYYLGNKEIEFPINVSSNTKINSKYSYIYNITYDYSGCDNDYDLPTTYYDKLGNITLPELSMDGYQFRGWYAVDIYGNYTKEYKKIDKTLDKDINLKAKFLKEFTVTYDTVLENADLDGDKEVIYTEEDAVELKEPTISGFTFAGWYLDFNYSVKATTYLNSDTTLYAKWDINNNIKLSDNLDKVFDNKEFNINVLATTEIDNVDISYSWYDKDDNLVVSDNNFNVKNAKESNDYYAIITFNYNDIVISSIKTNYVNVNIKKATYDMSNVSLEDLSIEYDGLYHTPSLVGTLPKGIDNLTVTYDYEEGIKYVGSKNVSCIFSTLSENYETPESMTAKVTITPRIITINWSDVNVFEYDGEVKSPAYTLERVLAADSDKISCDEDGKANGVGDYTFRILSIKPDSENIYKNYKLTSDENNLERQFSIVSKVNIIEGITVTDTTVEYDGEIHYPNVIVEPSGVRAKYNITPNIVGTYNVVVTFEYSNNPNEVIGNVYNATVTIKRRKIEVSWDHDTFEYNGHINTPKYEITNKVAGDDISLSHSIINSVNAGIYSINYISVEGEDKDNYEIPDGNFVYTIKPQIVSIDLDNLGFEDTEYEYNGKNLYPVIDKNRLPSNVSVSVTYEGYGKDAKTYDVIARFSSNSNNYVIDENTSFKKIKVVIKSKVAELNWGQTSFVYDTNEHCPTATLANLLNGDECNVTVTVSGSMVAIDVGDYTAEASGLDNPNYRLPDDEELKTIDFHIEQQKYDFMYTFNDISVEYDGLYHRPEVVFASEKPDWLNVIYSLGDDENTNGIKNVGVATITARFETTDDTYEVPAEPITATVTITAREAQIEFSIGDTTYTGMPIYPTATIANAIPGDTYEVVLDYIDNINVRNYVVNAIEIAGNDNYKITSQVQYSYEITKATYDTSNILFKGEKFTYDGFKHSLALTAKDEALGTEIKGADGYIVQVSYTDGIVNVGSKTITATFTVSPNYKDIPSMSATVTVIPKEVTLNWGAQNSFVYTGNVIKPECHLSGLVFSDTCDFTINAQGVNVGRYEASISNLTNQNYKLPANSSIEYEITKATLSLDGVSFNSTTKVYDGTPLYPEMVGTLPQNVEVAYENLSSEAGLNTITITFNVGNNYNSISPINVQVEITKRVASINWLSLEAVYTGTLSYPSYELTNIVFGDSCTLKINGGGIDVGEYEITVIGLDNTNYVLDSNENVTYTIIPAEYDMSGILFENVELVYNGQMQRPVVSGILPGVNITYSDGATNVSDGLVTVTATFVSNDDNYNSPKPMKATVRILPKELTATWNNTSVDYDGAKHSPTAILHGLIAGDECSATISGYGITAGTYDCEIVLLSNPNYYIEDASTILTINMIDYDMSGIMLNDTTFTYDGLEHQATISGNLTSVIGLDNSSPEIDEIIGTVQNVSDGAVTCTVTFKTTSVNYNAPEAMTCQISINAIKVDLIIKLDTNSSVSASAQSWTNSYALSTTYDGNYHGVIITYEEDDLITGDNVSFTIDGTFKNYANGNNGKYSFDISSSNSNYVGTYTTLDVTVNKLNCGYWWNGLTLGGSWPDNIDLTQLTEDVALVYVHTTLDLEYVGTEPIAYGNYKLVYRSISENVVINNPATSTSTYDVALTTTSLLGLIDFYDSNNDGLITDYQELANVENLYNQLGQTVPEIEQLINDSYAKYMEESVFIEFVEQGSKAVATSDYCTLGSTANLKDGIQSKTYYGHVFTTALKMESGTSITLNLDGTDFAYILLITDSASKRIKANGSQFTTASDGTLKLKFNGDPSTVAFTKYDSLNVYGIILIKE